jgi:hypothetical protein
VRVRHVPSLVFIAAMAASPIRSTGSNNRSVDVRGASFTTNFSSSNCPSPVNLCAAGILTGTIHGSIFAVVTSLSPGPRSGVEVGTATVVIHDPRGDLSCSETTVADVAPGGDGAEADLCIFTGGTGQWAGITGHFEAYGSTPAGQLTSGRYEGKLTLPQGVI